MRSLGVLNDFSTFFLKKPWVFVSGMFLPPGKEFLALADDLASLGLTS